MLTEGTMSGTEFFGTDLLLWHIRFMFKTWHISHKYNICHKMNIHQKNVVQC